MNCLFLETSSLQASVALFSGGELLAEDAFPAGRSPRSLLFQTLERFLKKVDTLDEIIVGVGPGSYSGIRIGISAAIGLGLARGISARGIFSALGYAGSHFQVVLDARGSWVYSLVREGVMQIGPLHCTREELEKRLEPTVPIFSPDRIPGVMELPVFPCASQLGKRFLENPKLANLPLAPLYLKAPHITVPAKTTRPNTLPAPADLTAENSSRLPK